ncbi:MAG: collagenase [Ardenticatenaceae bacterium]
MTTLLIPPLSRAAPPSQVTPMTTLYLPVVQSSGTTEVVTTGGTTSVVTTGGGALYLPVVQSSQGRSLAASASTTVYLPFVQSFEPIGRVSPAIPSEALPVERVEPSATAFATVVPTQEVLVAPVFELVVEPSATAVVPVATEDVAVERAVEPSVTPLPSATAVPSEEVVVEPSPEPVVEPSVTPLPSATAVATEEVAVERSVEPSVTPLPSATAVPTQEVVVAPSPEPVVEPSVTSLPSATAVPTQEVAVEPDVEPAVALLGLAPTEEVAVEAYPEPVVEPSATPVVPVATEDVAVEPDVEPTVALPAPEPTEDVAVEAYPEPVVEPSVTPVATEEVAVEPSVEPTATPVVAEATEEAVVEPSVEPTVALPAPVPTEDVAVEAYPEPAPPPTAMPTPTPDAPVTDLTTMKIGDTFAALRWPESEHDGQFVIDYSIDDSNFFNHGILFGDTSHYIPGGLVCDTVYYFQVYARTWEGERLPDPSYAISVTTAPCVVTSDPISPPTAAVTSSDLSCSDLTSADSATQQAIVEAQRECVPHFVYLVNNNPERYLDAFYKLISSSATDSLFGVVYDELYANRLGFNSDTVEQLYTHLPTAIDACVEDERCQDWSTYILPALEIGRLYQCPDVHSLDEAGLVQSLPYAGYSCTETIAEALAPLASESTLATILDVVESEQSAWSRRNALRVIGRLGQQVEKQQTPSLTQEAYQRAIEQRVTAILATEVPEKVLHEAVWILDTKFYPFFSMQPQLEQIITNSELETTLRFRATSALTRLMQAKSGLISQEDLDLITRLLQSDEVWVRALAALSFEVLQEEQLDDSRRELITNTLESAWATEEKLVAQAYLAKALDHYQGTQRHEELRNQYEATHLANNLSGEQITIRSGLPMPELPAFITLMEHERRAFFEIMGASFESPLTDDGNESITLTLFATKGDYQQYMSAFVGYGAHAGGLYIEKDGILYTYQREPGQSAYTVEELVQHEFAHYLLGRYVYPGLWTDPAYHDKLKGWSDEGLAEFFAGLSFDENGGYTSSPRDAYLNKLCGGSYRDLPSLLAQSEGYNEPGVFDYANGWSFIYYLMTERPAEALNLYNSFRNDNYQLDRFAEIAGVSSVSELEQEWHRSLDQTCATFDQHAQDQPSDSIHGSQENSPYPENNENIILHIPDAEPSQKLIELPPQ